MRWTEIVEAFQGRNGVILPTYRQMDVWTRAGLLTAESRGDRHGKFRWWPPSEIEAALFVAALMAYGFGVELAFQVARQPEDPAGHRTLNLTSNLGVKVTARSLPVEVHGR